jgi:hypothetical protein
MTSLKCPQCGLTNFATAPACKRCKNPLNEQPAYDASADSQPASGFYKPQTLQQPYNLNYTKNVWRDGSLLIMTKETILPNRCIKCNAPAIKLLRRTVEWYPRYVIVVFLLIRIVGLILYFCTRKRVTVYIGICEGHVNKRRFGVLAGFVIMLIGFVAFFSAMVNENFPVVFLGLLSILAGIIFMVMSWRTITAKKIEEPYVWVKGVHKDFLDTLPAA